MTNLRFNAIVMLPFEGCGTSETPCHKLSTGDVSGFV